MCLKWCRLRHVLTDLREMKWLRTGVDVICCELVGLGELILAAVGVSKVYFTESDWCAVRVLVYCGAIY